MRKKNLQYPLSQRIPFPRVPIVRQCAITHILICTILINYIFQFPFHSSIRRQAIVLIHFFKQVFFKKQYASQQPFCSYPIHPLTRLKVNKFIRIMTHFKHSNSFMSKFHDSDQHSETSEYEETPCNMIDLRTQVRALQKMYTDQKLKRIATEQRLLDFRKQSIRASKQFYAVLQKYRVKSFTYNQDDFRSQIEEIYDQILHNFQKSNQETHTYLQEKYENNYQFMNRRINEIVIVMSTELKKQAKISQMEHHNICQEIEASLEEALKIQSKNVQMSKTIKQLKFNMKIVKEEKALLINQVLEKKQIIQKLNEKIKAMEEDNYSFLDDRDSVSNHQSVKSPVQIKYRGTMKRTSTPKSIHQQDFTLISKKMNNQFYDTKTIGNNTLFEKPQTPSTQTGVHLCRNRKLTSNSSLNYFNPKNNKNSHPTLQFQGNQNYFKQRVHQQRKNASALETRRNEKVKCDCVTSKQSYQRTIQHLKKTVERYKMKLMEMQKIISQIQLKNQQIKGAAEAAFEKTILGENTIDKSVLIGEKQLQLLINLKKKVVVSESPGKACGWGKLAGQRASKLKQK